MELLPTVGVALLAAATVHPAHTRRLGPADAWQAPVFSDKDRVAVIAALCDEVTAGSAADPIGGTPERVSGFLSPDRATLYVELLSTTYEEGGVSRHLLVLGGHAVEDGEIASSETATTEVHVGVLDFQGGRWILRARGAPLTETGFNGRDPQVELRRIGDDRHGLEVRSALWNRGSGQSMVSVYDLGATQPAELLHVATDADDCGWEEKCFRFEGTLAYQVKPGTALYDVRLDLKGTYRNAAGRVVPIPRGAPIVFRFSRDSYEPVLASATRRAFWEAVKSPWD